MGYIYAGPLANVIALKTRKYWRWYLKPSNRLASNSCWAKIPSGVGNMLTNSKSKHIQKFWSFLKCVGHSIKHHKNRFECFTDLALQLLQRMSESFVVPSVTFAYSLEDI